MSVTNQITAGTYCYSSGNIFSRYKDRTNVLLAKFLEDMYKGYQSSKAYQKLSFDDKVDCGVDYLLVKEFIQNLTPQNT
jgi:hypothetical protein